MQIKSIRQCPASTIRITRQIEWGIAGGLTGILLLLHTIVLYCGGALWRDEVNIVDLALSPAKDMWHAYPLVTTSLLRGWINLGCSTDIGLRWYGWCVGVGILAVIWCGMIRTKKCPPTFTLVLFALNPFTIRYLDSVRAYGLGVLFLLATLFWFVRILQQSTWRNSLIGLFLAVLSVHALYQNVVFITALVLSAALVFGVERNWRGTAIMVMILCGVAFSILPMTQLFAQKSDNWVLLETMPLDYTWMYNRMADIVNYSYVQADSLWITLLLLSLFVSVYEILRKPALPHGNQERRVLIFFCAVLLLSIFLYIGFLSVVKVYSEIWYYLPLFALLACCLDVLITSIRPYSILRLFICTCFVAIVGLDTITSCQMGNTDIDVLAHQLSHETKHGDVILLNPWYTGVTFQRYYRGNVPWMTIPEIQDCSVHRYDLIKQKMQEEQPLNRVFQAIQTALDSGHTVWMVNTYGLDTTVQNVHPLAPAPKSSVGWSEIDYTKNWGQQVCSYLQQRCKPVEGMSWKASHKIDTYESAQVFKWQGDTSLANRSKRFGLDK